MTTRTLISIFCLITCASLHAMQADTSWVRTNGTDGPDVLMDMATDSAGATYVTGYVWAGLGNNDIMTIKFYPNGDTAWLRVYDGPASGDDRGNGVAVDRWGNVYVCGMSDTTNNIADWLVMKYQPDGQLVWCNRFGGFLARDEAFLVAADDSGYVCVAGTMQFAATGDDIVTTRWSPTGSLLWQKAYDGGGHGYDHPYDLELDSAGNIVVCGQYSSPASNPVYVTMKYSANGDLQWDRTYDSPEIIDLALAIDLDGSSNIYVTGYNQPLSGIQVGTTTIKYSPTGDTVWTKTYDDPFGAEDFAQDIAVDELGHAYVVGYMNAGFFGQAFTVIKYELNGDTAWVRMYPGASSNGSRAFSVAVDRGGNVYATGFIGLADVNYQNVLTVSLQPDGTQRWARQFDSPDAASDAGLRIAVDSLGEVHVAGSNGDYLSIKYLQFLCGDADGNGIVNISDAVHLINYIFSGGPAPGPQASGDCDCSGIVTVSDAVYLINYIFAGGTQPCAACP